MKIEQYKPSFNRKEIANDLYKYALSDGRFSEYRLTEAFEEEIAKFLGVKYCIMNNNGTIGLSLALLAMGVKKNDKVIIPNITMFGTQAAIDLIGAIPVFVDVDKANLCLDLQKAKEEILFSWNNIKAVIYVTLNGRSHDAYEYFRFKNFCEKQNIVMIEDNAQSFGSYYKDSYKISCPDNSIGSFSFSIPKIISTGQGGCLVTNDDKIANKIKKLKDFGRTGGGIDRHDDFGINSKFTELQAIVGLSQIKEIKEKVLKKKKIYSTYKEALKEVQQIKFLEFDDQNYRWVPWFIDVFVDNRDGLQSYLDDQGIVTRAIYPELTSQKVNSRWLQPKTLKVSGEYARTGLWLPSSLDITKKEIQCVCDKIKEYYAQAI